MRLLALFVLAAGAVAAGCDLNGPAAGLTGTWEGEIAAGAARYPVTLHLADTGARITGDGTVAALPEGRFDFTVTDGSFVGTAVELTLEFRATPFRGSLSGTLRDNRPARVEGTFHGHGEANGAVTIELVAR